VQNCYATGSVKSDKNRTNSSNKTDFYTPKYGSNAGGVVGYNDNGSAVEKCYFNGTVSGDSGVGGIVGKNEGSDITTSVKNNVALGTSTTVTGTSDLGRIVGVSAAATITNYSNISGSWPNNGPNTKNGEDINASPNGYHVKNWWTGTVGFNSVDVWNIVEGSLPTLRNMPDNPTQSQ